MGVKRMLNYLPSTILIHKNLDFFSEKKKTIVMKYFVNTKVSRILINCDENKSDSRDYASS